MRYDTGFELGLIAFTAAVLGGIGNLAGATLGGILIGFIQAFNEGLTHRSARRRLDPVDRVRDPHRDPRLPPRGPPRRADAGGRLMADRGHAAPRRRPRRTAFGEAWRRCLDRARVIPGLVVLAVAALYPVYYEQLLGELSLPVIQRFPSVSTA